MKKALLAAALLVSGAASMNAQLAMTKPGFFDNWSIGLDGGVTTPLNHGAFWGDMRGIMGLHLQKQITPAFALGAEANWAVNTSSWNQRYYGPRSKTAFDSQYVGVYGALNLCNLFAPSYSNQPRLFDLEAVGGAGWGHQYRANANDWNYFATKVGLNFNFHVTEKVTVSFKPSVSWDMSDSRVYKSSCAYNANRGQLNLMAGVSVALGKGFNYVEARDASEIDALNAKINDMRGELENAAAALTQANAANQALAAELAACRNKKPEVVTTTTDQLSTVRYVNFELGRYNITASQMPNVAAVASYLKNHPNAKVVIKGYASQDGPVDVNIRLANQRAESVKDTLIKKYGIAASRIQAEGQGIGHMFEEESWNRVAICTLDEPAKSVTTVK